jgi:hypothetical protein
MFLDTCPKCSAFHYGLFIKSPSACSRALFTKASQACVLFIPAFNNSAALIYLKRPLMARYNPIRKECI